MVAIGYDLDIAGPTGALFKPFSGVDFRAFLIAADEERWAVDRRRELQYIRLAFETRKGGIRFHGKRGSRALRNSVSGRTGGVAPAIWMGSETLRMRMEPWS